MHVTARRQPTISSELIWLAYCMQSHDCDWVEEHNQNPSNILIQLFFTLCCYEQFTLIKFDIYPTNELMIE